MPLRPMTEEDLAMVRIWRNSPTVRQNMYTKHEISESEHKTWFEKIQADEMSKWLIHEEANGHPDGVVYFTNLLSKSQSAFWGFYAADNARRGVGIRMEFDALEMAFIEFKLHKLNCEVFVTNKNVIKLHSKFGFKEEGVFRDYYLDGEKYINVVRMGIINYEWFEKRVEVINRLERLGEKFNGN